MVLPEMAYPGLKLGQAPQYASGPGTYLSSSTGSIHASLIGKPSLSSTSTSTTANTSRAGYESNTISVNQHHPSTPLETNPSIPSKSITARNTLPRVNDVVLCRVTRLQTRQITVGIVAVGEEVCGDTFTGVVRREDVRGWEVDRVVLHEAFRVGDIVRAGVISLGDQSSYYLTTARNDLGVLMAVSEDGNVMHPISWKEFRDPVTGKLESRKVAKPI